MSLRLAYTIFSTTSRPPTKGTQLIRIGFAVVFAVSPPLIEASLKFEQIVRNVIHRIPPKIRSGIDGNDSRSGAQKSGAIAESE